MKRIAFTAVLVAYTALIAQSQNGVIAGRILGIDGMPAAGIRVAAASPNEQGQISSESLVVIGRTDETGHYRLDALPPGRYGILAGAVTSPTYYPGRVDPASAEIVTVVPGSTVVGLDFKLAISPVAPQLRGVSIGAGALSPIGPAIQVSGRIVIEGQLPPPDVLSDFEATFRGYQTMQIGAGTTIASGTAIFLSQLGAASLQPAVLAGTGTIVRTAPVQNGGVTQLVFSPAKGGSGVRSDGTFQFVALPGEYVFSVNRATPPNQRQDDYFLKSVSLGAADLLSDRFRVSGALPEEILLTLGVGARVSGHIQNEDGEPEANMEVYLIPESTPAEQSSERRSAVTDAQGNFLLRGISPGDYRFSAETALDPSREAQPITVTGTRYHLRALFFGRAET